TEPRQRRLLFGHLTLLCRPGIPGRRGGPRIQRRRACGRLHRRAGRGCHPDLVFGVAGVFADVWCRAPGERRLPLRQRAVLLAARLWREWVWPARALRRRADRLLSGCLEGGRDPDHLHGLEGLPPAVRWSRAGQRALQLGHRSILLGARLRRRLRRARAPGRSTPPGVRQGAIARGSRPRRHLCGECTPPATSQATLERPILGASGRRADKVRRALVAVRYPKEAYHDERDATLRSGIRGGGGGGLREHAAHGKRTW